jgi:hypothetical protein
VHYFFLIARDFIHKIKIDIIILHGTHHTRSRVRLAIIFFTLIYLIIVRFMRDILSYRDGVTRFATHPSILQTPKHRNIIII